MTVPNANKRDDYVGGGPDLVYSFRIFDEDELRVVKAVVATGVESDLVLNTDYTVADVGDATGSITLIDATVAADLLAGTIRISILRNLEFVQPTDVRNLGQFYPAVHEDEFDRLLMQIQQLTDDLERSIKLPRTEAGTDVATMIPDAATRADGILGFDSSGNPTIVSNIVTFPTVTLGTFFGPVAWLASNPFSVIQNFLSAGSLAAALSALSISTFMQDFLTKTTATLARVKLGFTTGAKFILQGDMGLLSVGTPELINSAVTGAKIATATITGDKFAALKLGIEQDLVIAKTGATGIGATAAGLGIEEYYVPTFVSAYLTTNVNTPDGTDGTAAGVIATGWQALWAIYNPTTDDHATVSTSVLTSVGPNLAGANFAGYTKKRHIGFFYYSTIVEDFRQIGREFFHQRATPAAITTSGVLSGAGSFVAVTTPVTSTPALRLAVTVSTKMDTGNPVSNSTFVLYARPTSSAMDADIINSCAGAGTAPGWTGGKSVLLQDASRGFDLKAVQTGWSSPTLTMNVTGFKVPQL